MHETICNTFDRVVDGEIDRVLLLCPPQHGKSTIASRRMPAYILGRKPHWDVIGVSAASPLAEEFGGAVRNCISSPEYQRLFPRVRLSEDTNAKGRWQTREGGGYFATGIGGAVMGRGADLGVIDDPFANWEDAQSAAQQAKVWAFYRGTFYNRIRPGGAIVVIQHRMHVNDLVGRLLDAMSEDGKDQWTVINIPADLDNPPWPQRYDRAALERIKANTDSRQWLSLYMQQPVAPGGGEFKRDWIEYYEADPEEVGEGTNKYLLVDPASGRRKDKGNDYTTMWVLGLGADKNYYVLDLVRDKLNLTERTAELFRLHAKWKPLQTRYEEYGMQADIEHIRYVQNLKNYRFAITPVGGAVVKEQRIRRMIPIFEQHRMWLPTSIHRTMHDGVTRNMIDQFVEEELLAFPGSRHDDGLDAMARIAEPDPELSLVWPKEMKDANEKKDRYRPTHRSTSSWAS
jgi:predicted phage terminase large subunit-like protein